MKIVKFHGGLGNQMFQYCFYEKLFLENKDVVADLSFFKKVKAHNGFELEKIFKIELKEIDEKTEEFIYSKKRILKLKKSIFKKIKKFKIYTFADTVYDSKIMKDSSEIIFYDGYWQSEKYFDDIKKLIYKKFSFPEIVDLKNKVISEKIKLENSVSIHARRGDYVGHPQLDGLASIEYYKKAIEYIRLKVKNPKFFIFSNDLKWCEDNLPLSKDELQLVDGNFGENSYRDMQLMSLCKHNIIPNSSFSWWGAWLNKNPDKIVIAPERWFSEESQFSYDDIVPKSWIKLKNF